MSRVSVLFSLFLILSYTATATADWIEISRHASNVYIAYMDPATKQATEHGYAVWKMREYVNPQQDEGTEHTYLSDKAFTEYDCSGHRMRELMLHDYSGHHATGTLLHSTESPLRWEKIQPGSVGEASYNFVCAG
jgi:hypothetical protein